MLLIAAPAVAGEHPPPEKRYKQVAPEAPAPAPNPGASAGVEFRSTARPLRTLAHENSLILLGDVVRTEPFDEDRLHVFHVRVLRTLRGAAATPEISVVDIRGESQRPPLLVDGEHVVLFLRPSPKLSYLSQQLGDGPLFDLPGRRDAVVPIAHDDDADIVTAIVQNASNEVLKDEALVAAQRELARRELASSSARLIQDALVELAAMPGWPPLTGEEVAAFKSMLADKTVPPGIRAEGVRLLGARKAVDGLSAVMSALIDTPDLLDAVLLTREKLGAPATREELAARLQDKSADIRSAAVRALAASGDPTALSAVGRIATDDADSGVRVAAIDALGATGSQAAVPLVAPTFDNDDRNQRQHAGRALLALGGDAADQSFIDMALKGKSSETQRYAALLLVVARGKDHPAVKRLLSLNPNNDVRAVIEDGIKFRHMHEHEGP